MKPKSKWVQVPSVRVFDDVEPGKMQALKPLEEAAEVFAAWQEMCGDGDGGDTPPCNTCERPKGCYLRDDVVDECCDVIQAVCNLLASLGVHDLRKAMERCTQRNRDRGRITK